MRLYLMGVLSRAGFEACPERGRYTSLAVSLCIIPMPCMLFSSLFISMTRIWACGVDGLVRVLPILVFLPRFVVEP